MTASGADHWLHLGDARVRWVDHGGPAHPLGVVVCVHGLGGSAVNWEALAARLTDDYRVVALDLVGFGLTDAGSRGAGLEDNLEVLSAVIDAAVPGERVVLVGNSMGGLLSARYAVQHPERVAGLALLDTTLPPPGRIPPWHTVAGLALYGSAPVGRGVNRARRAWGSPEQLVDATVRLCGGDPRALDPGVRARHVEMAQVRIDRPELDPLFGQAARETVWAIARPGDGLSMYAGVSAPVLLVHGTADRLVPYGAAVAAARAHPSWRFVTLRGLGHIPMIEAPDRVARVLRDWLSGPAVRLGPSAP